MIGRFPSVGVFTIDLALVVRSWDGWLADVTGIPEADACGRRLDELYPELVERGLVERLRRVAESGVVEVLAPAFHEYLLPCPPRDASAHFTRMQQHVTIAPLRDGGAIVGASVTIEDATPRLDRERTLAARLHADDDAARLDAVLALAAEPWGTGPLIGALGDRNWRVRRAAAEGLARGSDERVVDALADAVRERHRDPAILNAALSAIVLSEHDVLPRLVELLEATETEPDVRNYLALTLGLLEDARAVPALVRSLEHPDANVRYHAVEALGRIGARETAIVIAGLLDARDFQFAFAALDALSAIGESSIAPALVPLLDDPLLHTAAAEALGTLGSADAAGPLAALLGKAGTSVAAVAGALATLYARLEARAGDGKLVASIVRALVTADTATELIQSLSSANDEERTGLVLVLSWLDAEGVESALASSLVHLGVRRLGAERLADRGEAAVNPLLGVLATGDAEVRKAAAAALGCLGAGRAAEALLELLDDEAEVAIVAAGALARIGDARALEALLAQLDHPQAAVRQAAVSAINSIGHPDTVARVRPLLASSAPHVREGAAKIVGYLGLADCLDALMALASDAEAAVRRVALEQLAHVDDARAIATILRALSAQAAGERAAAARALGIVHAAVSVPALMGACGDTDPWVRYYAARSLGQHASAAAAPMLTALAVTDAAPPVRIAAVQALETLGDPRVLGAVRPLAEDTDDMVAGAALQALGACDDSESLRLLLHALTRPERSRVRAALTALGRRADSAAVARIEETARSSDDHDVCALAIEVLARTGGARAISALIELAADRRRGPLAVAALAHLGAEHVASIAHGFARARPGARCAVIEAIARMRHRGAVPVLVEALDDESAAVRLAATQALGRLDLRDAEARLDVVARTDADAAVRRAAHRALAR